MLDPDEECWRGVVGRHGLDERNEADEEMLQLCAYMNQSNVMNTYYLRRMYTAGLGYSLLLRCPHMTYVVMMWMVQWMYRKILAL